MKNDNFFKIGKLVTMQRLHTAFAKWSVLVKNSKSQNHVKNVFRITLELFCAKNGSKKHLTDKKWQLFQNRQTWSVTMQGQEPINGLLARAIAFAKWSVLVKNSNSQNHVKNVSRTTLELFIRVVLYKKRLQKTPNISKITTFSKSENRSLCKGYSLCKMVSVVKN